MRQFRIVIIDDVVDARSVAEYPHAATSCRFETASRMRIGPDW